MEKKVIVKVEDVSIKFSLASEKFDGFKEYFIERVKKKITYEDFWALPLRQDWWKQVQI